MLICYPRHLYHSYLKKRVVEISGLEYFEIAFGIGFHFLYGLAVNLQIVEMDIMIFACELVAFGQYIVELAVLDVYVIDVVVFIQPVDKDAELAFLTCDVSQIHIAHHGRKAPVTFLLVLILQVDAHDGFIAYADFDIAHEDVFDDAASTVAGLDAYHAVEQRAVHLAVFHVEVAVASGNLTSDDHSSVAVLHPAVAYDDVFAWRGPAASVGIAA